MKGQSSEFEGPPVRVSCWRRLLIFFSGPRSIPIGFTTWTSTCSMKYQTRFRAASIEVEAAHEQRLVTRQGNEFWSLGAVNATAALFKSGKEACRRGKVSTRCITRCRHFSKPHPISKLQMKTLHLAPFMVLQPGCPRPERLAEIGACKRAGLSYFSLPLANRR
jgi:hypothetical protein